MINFVCQLPLGQLDGDNQTDENRREREREARWHEKQEKVNHDSINKISEADKMEK